MGKQLESTKPSSRHRHRDDIRVFSIHGIEYYLDWRKLGYGFSFFIPTTATPVQVKEVLKDTFKQLGFKTEIHARCEYGRYGVRVWRVY